MESKMSRAAKKAWVTRRAKAQRSERARQAAKKAWVTRGARAAQAEPASEIPSLSFGGNKRRINWENNG